ncbi:HRDC domain-containing protein [Corynebacterium aquatimens]|uniref:Ribonuclease D n=1 Tax=Corynebacterium aquatimens TaxID=1190508 RepID=A0A931DX63_9CORY|nr:HRDC domain-containing protein [Corynebacterium aquatimens]MBG6121745.1 ribonuclease D [Corynebacterium aquatimens]WJY65716.1 Ribonuclease D [Corynebacterium aquatimens]
MTAGGVHGVGVKYTYATTPDHYRAAAESLAAGRGPFAIDTERASSFRYDDRAFLVQIARRDAGTFLIAPEHHRHDMREIFAPVVGGTDWILHAAPEDLPSLAELGLYPGTLFDTALAGRIAGFDKPNLAAMVEEFCGVVLEKGHGREDWSLTPLPEDWLRYVAADVDYLCDLAEAQAEYLDAAGKLDIAEAEFAHIISRNAAGDYVPEHSWRKLKGVSALKNPVSLALAQRMWEERDALAAQRDIAPNRVLNGRVIIEVAKTRPRSARDLARIHGFPARRRGAVALWFGIISEVYEEGAPRTLLNDEPARNHTQRLSDAPSKSVWKSRHPHEWDLLNQVRDGMIQLGEDASIAPEILVEPAVLRAAVWELTQRSRTVRVDDAAHALLKFGARPWQAEAAAPVIATALA